MLGSAVILMKSGLLHEQTTSCSLSASLCYELDVDRYPTLGNEFFIHLRQKYPRAFRRTIPCDAEKLSLRSSSSSEDSRSVWSLWDCNGDDDKAMMMEAGGTLIPRCDIPVHERLKRISHSFSSVKSTGSDLLATLRSFRSALLAENSNSSQLGMENVGQAHSSSVITRDSFYGGTDAASNPATSNSVSRNSSCEVKSLRDLPKEDPIPRVSSVRSAKSDVQPEIVSAVSCIDATLNSHSSEHDMMPVQSVDVNVSACNSDINSTLLEEDAENQLPSHDKLRSFSNDPALIMEHDHTDTNQRLVESS